MTQLLIAVDSVNWTAVTCPINCRTIIFDNNETSAQDVNRRILDTDANTQKKIPVGSAYEWEKSPDAKPLSSRSVFTTGSVVAYLKSVAGSFNVAVEFIE